MSRFQFRLESLLRYRRYRRDVLRSLYAGLLATKNEILSRRDALAGRRERQVTEIRRLVSPGGVDVDAASRRRYHIARISADLLAQAETIEQIDRQLTRCLQELTSAEQDVRSIEKLKDSRRLAHDYEQNRREQKELEDAWAAANSCAKT